MSPDALTGERVYRDLRRQIITGEIRPGGQIPLQAVADSFATSISPIRDALQRLVGERLVDIHGGGGFTAPALTLQKARNLYRWHADLCRMALRDSERTGHIGEFPGGTVRGRDIAPDLLAATAGELFARLGACSNNSEHLHAIIAIGERLHLLRLQEKRLGRSWAELHSLWDIVRTGNRNAARIAIWYYHRRRLMNVEDLFRQAFTVPRSQDDGGSSGSGDET